MRYFIIFYIKDNYIGGKLYDDSLGIEVFGFPSRKVAKKKISQHTKTKEDRIKITGITECSEDDYKTFFDHKP